LLLCTIQVLTTFGMKATGLLSCIVLAALGLALLASPALARELSAPQQAGALLAPAVAPAAAASAAAAAAPSLVENHVSPLAAPTTAAGIRQLAGSVTIPSASGYKVAHVFNAHGAHTVCIEGVAGTCAGKALASATYNASLTTSGWDVLNLVTAADFPDTEQAYAAGFLEGALTAKRIKQFVANWVKKGRSDAAASKLNAYLAKQDAYVRGQVAALGHREKATLDHSSEALYWYTVGLVLQQFDGMVAGYNAAVVERDRLTKEDFWLLNNDGDLLDIERFVTPGMRFKSVPAMSRNEVTSFLALNGHCTAIVKHTGDDLVIGHATWSDYSEQYRIHKHYTLNYSLAKSKRSSYSSYPGMVYSSDDLYVLDSGLVVLETTLTILNEQLYKKCAPEGSVLTYVRALVANMLASSAPEWVQIFSQHNSGTYNNQWMIVDYNKFTPSAPPATKAAFFELVSSAANATTAPAATAAANKSATTAAPPVKPVVVAPKPVATPAAAAAPTTPAKDLLWVLEQIPGRIVAKDMTAQLLSQSYWGSYNRPFFAEINDESMFKHFSSKHGEAFSYKTSSRAKIMQREQAAVKDVAGVQALLRHNNYLNDPFSQGCPWRALAARFDLPGTPQCEVAVLKTHGATDAKVTSFKWRGQQKIAAVAGPTTGSGAVKLPPFSFSQGSGAYRAGRGEGLPNKFDFSWVDQVPTKVPTPPMLK
jgi:hypothetical protein